MYQVFRMLFSLNDDTLRLFSKKKLLCAGNNCGEKAAAECYCDHDF